MSQMALSSSSVLMERTGLAGADCARSSAVAMMISLGSLWLGPVSGVHPIAGPLPSGRMPGETLSGFRLADGGDVGTSRPVPGPKGCPIVHFTPPLVHTGAPPQAPPHHVLK